MTLTPGSTFIQQLQRPHKASMVGLTDLKFLFHGRSAHAGGSPHLGRSALDAVELMNVGVNYLREHVTKKCASTTPSHTAATCPMWSPTKRKCGTSFAHISGGNAGSSQRVRKVAEGAALMTENRMEEIFQGACSYVLSNHYLADLQYENMKEIGASPIHR